VSEVTEALKELEEPLAELGRRWAKSPHRPRVQASVLKEWDDALNLWLHSELPLILRDSRQRGKEAFCSNGRKVIFADNTPANWVLELALEGKCPDIAAWTADNMIAQIPLTILTKGEIGKRKLNKAGWKICHIKSVSDGKRFKVATAPHDAIETKFLKFLSPRNMFLIPKRISGAGELPEVIKTVKAYEDSRGNLFTTK